MMKRAANKPGFYQGKHFTEYVEQVKALKRAKQVIRLCDDPPRIHNS